MIHQDQGNLRSLLWAKIGEVCIDRNVDGTCGKEEEGACTLMEKLPAVTEAILKVRSDRMEPYIQSIRDNVCAYCECQRKVERSSFAQSRKIPFSAMPRRSPGGRPERQASSDAPGPGRRPRNCPSIRCCPAAALAPYLLPWRSPCLLS